MLFYTAHYFSLRFISVKCRSQKIVSHFFYKISFPKRGINHLSFYLLSYTYKIARKESGFNPLSGTFSKKEKETSLCPHKGHQFNRKTYYCVPGTRTQPLICVGCFLCLIGCHVQLIREVILRLHFRRRRRHTFASL